MLDADGALVLAGAAGGAFEGGFHGDRCEYQAGCGTGASFIAEVGEEGGVGCGPKVLR
jgi:hypothetical protein